MNANQRESVLASWPSLEPEAVPDLSAFCRKWHLDTPILLRIVDA